VFSISHVERSDVLPPAKPDRNILTAAKGGGIMFVGRLFAYISRFIIAFLLARLLGAEQYGLYQLTLTTATLAGGLALLGLDTALVRYVALFASRRDEAGLWGALQIGLGITAVLSVLIGGGLYILANPIAEQLFHEPTLAPLLRLISLVVPLLTLSDILAGATRGFKKMQYTAIAQDIARPLIRLILIVVLAIMGLSAARALIIFGLAFAISFGMLVYFLHKEFSLKRPLGSARYDTRAMLSFSVPVYLSGLMTTFQSSLQTVLLGALNTVTSVGIFTVASRVNLVGQMFHNSVTTAAGPVIAELYGRGEREQMGRLYQTTNKWVFTLNLPIFLTIVLFPAPILSIFGKSFVDGSTALVLLAGAAIVNAGTGMCGAVLDMTGYTKLKLVNSIVQLVLSLGSNILLIPRWGVAGAATTVLIVTCAVNGLRLLEVFILLRLLPYNLSFLKPITAGLVTLAVVLAIGRWLPVEANLIYTAIQVLIIFAVYAAITLLLGLSPEELVVLARLRRRIRITLSRN
jgi:O-antigen/teichoic acid export membrane protein